MSLSEATAVTANNLSILSSLDFLSVTSSDPLTIPQLSNAVLNRDLEFSLQNCFNLHLLILMNSSLLILSRIGLHVVVTRKYKL